MFVLQDALRRAGLDLGKRIKLVRHAPEPIIKDYWQAGYLDEYEAMQGPSFGPNFDYLISFIASGKTRATFLWIKQRLATSDRCTAVNNRRYFAEEEYLKPGYHFQLERLPFLENLEGNFQIEWPHKVRPYQAVLGSCGDILLVEMRSDLLKSNFEAIDKVDLSLADLRAMTSEPEAFRDWKAALSSVSGVYLISSPDMPDLYVGSATGEGGIWGRWSEYAASHGHGGNVQLKQLFKRQPDAPRKLRWTILRTSPLKGDRKDVQRLEADYAKRLGSRVIRLETPAVKTV